MAKKNKQQKQQNARQSAPKPTLYQVEGEKDATPPGLNQFNKYVANAMVKAHSDNSDRRLYKVVRSNSARWELSLLHHLGHRLSVYPLPGIYFAGISGPLSARTLPVVPSTTTNAYSILADDGFYSGRYDIYNGHINKAVVVHSPSSNVKHGCMIFDPTDYDKPVSFYIVNPDGTLLFESAYGWTGRPFVGVDNLLPNPNVDPTGDNTSNFSQYNNCYIWPGGYVVSLNYIDKTAYTSCRMRVRTMQNSVNSFTNLYLDDRSLVDYENFQKCEGAKAFYSGNQWTKCVSYPDISTMTAPNRTAWNFRRLQTAITNGYPIIEFEITNSAINDFMANFQVVVNGWMGLAPLFKSNSDAMPFETVPFKMPFWFIIGRSSGNAEGIDYGAVLSSPYVGEHLAMVSEASAENSTGTLNKAAVDKVAKAVSQALNAYKFATGKTSNFAQRLMDGVSTLSQATKGSVQKAVVSAAMNTLIGYARAKGNARLSNALEQVHFTNPP